MPARNLRKPPDDLDAESRALWRRTLEQLEAQRTFAESDIPILAMYVRALEVARHARARIAARVQAGGDDAHFTRGSMRQLVQHPDIKTAREAEHDAAAYAASLLITSRERKRHKIRRPRTSPSQLELILGGRQDDDGSDRPGRLQDHQRGA
jgi:phage terminase small subunit